MNNYSIIYLIIAVAFPLLLNSCEMDVSPSDQISTESLATSSDGLLNVINGNYALFKEVIEFDGRGDWTNNYMRQYFQLSDFASDDVVCAQVSDDPLYLSFTYIRTPSQTNAQSFWYVSYKIINGCNTIIEMTEDMEEIDDFTLQLLGESYFLRAFSHFNILRLYAKPYNQGDPGTNPGVIIRKSTLEDPRKERASVQECYQFVIEDLKKAASLMHMNRGKMYASKEAAWAFLSRVYLYMGDHANTIAYADSVISSNRFTLETSESYPGLFASSLDHDETIFAIEFTPADNLIIWGSVAAMYYSDGNSGWGEEFASPSLREVMNEDPDDVRWSYIWPKYKADSSLSKKDGIPVYYITKFSFQDGEPNLSSPIMFRLAEMYLNRAEANAKLGNEADALADVNEIRKNRGLEDALVNTVPAGSTILDVVLKERRVELAFEGHRLFDLLRNEIDLERNFWGYHIIGLRQNQIDLSTQPTGYDNLLIAWDDPRMQYFIPIGEILTNDLCIQNE